MQRPTISNIIPQSIAGQTLLKAGWQLLQINGKQVRDIIDYQIAITDNKLETIWLNTEGEQVQITLDKEMDQDLGIEFSTLTLDKPISCKNHCLFCFVDQLPRGLRRTLYYKDDDYRLSFLSGSYITLSNTSWADLERIVALKLSPLYISVHAWQPEIRQALVRCNHDDFQEKFIYLIEHGIEMHCQIVVCPEMNDGKVLQQTAEQLLTYLPSILSVALVPVGLTGHREKLHPLRLHRGEEAEALLNQINELQQIALEKTGSRLFWAADEIYLKANRSIPSADYYEGYPVLEDGVGLIRSFWEEWGKIKSKSNILAVKQAKFRLVTGVSGAYALQPIVDELNLREDLKVNLQVIQNDFFGHTVTVSGLITGGDIIKQLTPEEGELVLLPGIMLRDGGDVYLDNTKPEDIENAFPETTFQWIEPTATALFETIFLQKSNRKKKTIRRSI